MSGPGFEFVLKIEAKKVGGVSLLFKLKLNEFHFCKENSQVFIMQSSQNVSGLVR